LNSAISGNSGQDAGPRQAWREGVFGGQENRLFYKARLRWWLLEIRVAAITAIWVIPAAGHRHGWPLVLLLPSGVNPQSGGAGVGSRIRLTNGGSRRPDGCEVRHLLCCGDCWKKATHHKDGKDDSAFHGSTPCVAFISASGIAVPAGAGNWLTLCDWKPHKG
jgi:hypothetical protein